MLLRRGAITKAIAAAADRFRQAFRIAGVDRLRARDMTRALGSGGSAAEQPSVRRAWSTMRCSPFGGARSVAASALWYVIGLEIPVSRWSLQHAGLSESRGQGARDGAKASGR